jgi:steroid delta-isomerase-like uncharacterized protein
MRSYLLTLVYLIAGSFMQAEDMTNHRKDVWLWYDAFTNKDPALLEKILSDNWTDIPPAPGQPPGPEGAKKVLAELSTAFPDFKVTIEEILQDGDKVVVRSKISGTQKGTFTGFPGKNRAMTIQAVDIHEFKDGKIIRTWHTEDWMTGFHQLGVFDK